MLWLLPMVPLLAAPAALLPGCRRSRRRLASLAVTVMSADLVLAVLAVQGDWQAGLVWGPDLRLTAALDPGSATMTLLIPAVALPVVLYAAVQEAGLGLARLVALLLAFAGAMQLLVVADDLLTLLVGWELVGACSWALIAHEWRDPAPPRDAATAFLVTRFGDLGLFLAAMITFAATGSFAFTALGTLEGHLLELAVLGIVVSALAKSAQVPFSFWLFNAMSGPSSVSALLHAATMVAAGAYLLARLHPTLDQVTWFAPATVAVGLITALAGGLVALLQPHVKKLLAASTSAHFGLMLVAVGAGYPAVAMLHLVAHAWFKSLLFLSAGVVAELRHTHLLALMRDGIRLPVTAALAACGAAALAGIPPLGGAWSKELIGAAAGKHGHWLAVAVLVSGGLSAAYAARWQWLALGTTELTNETETGRPSRPALAALAIPAAVTLASALIWLPPLHEAVGAWFDADLPSPRAWETAGSLALLVIGLYTGYWLARMRPHLGRRARAAAVADWLGLPKLLQRLVVHPALGLAAWTARVDDAFVDRPVGGLAKRVRSLSLGASRADDAVLDAPVSAAARLGNAAARSAADLLEAVGDGVVHGTARLLGSAGGDAVRLETGLAHHYLAWIAIGAAVLVAIILLA